MAGRDPFYHPALSLTVQDHVLSKELVRAPSFPRVAKLSFGNEEMKSKPAMYPVP